MRNVRRQVGGQGNILQVSIILRNTMGYSGIRGFAENKETKNGKLLTSYRVQDPKDAWYQFKEYAF